MFTLIKPKAEPTKVASRHIPFIEPLWQRLDDGRKAVAAKEEYVRTAGQLGIKVAPLESVADSAASGAKAVARADKTLERIKKVLAAGCEPTTPNIQWYVGALEVPQKVQRRDSFGDTFRGYPDETWPGRHADRFALVAVFTGAMPIEAMTRLAAVKALMDDVRVYSPHEEHFRRLENREPVRRVDPVLVGGIWFLGQQLYFEIARWDIDGDLAALFERVG